MNVLHPHCHPPTPAFSDVLVWCAVLFLFEVLPAQSPAFRQLTTDDGLAGSETYDIDSRGDQVWVATPRGLVRLPPKREASAIPPAPRIERLLVGGAARPVTGRVQPAWPKNDLQLYYLALNYPLNGKINYRYRLREDQPWTISRERTANYPELAPGNYRFEVQAQDELGHWSASAVLPLKIVPPWWRRDWFLGLSGLLVLTLGLTLYKYRTTQLKRAVAIQRLRTEQVEQKMKMESEMNRLRQSALRAQINPHFIFNCLNSIQSCVLEEEQDKAVRYLSRFARLIRLVLNASLDDRVALEEEIHLLRSYLELEQMRYKDRFDFRIELAEDLDLFELTVPPMLLQPYVENAIVHGLADAKRSGCIHIGFQRKNGYLLATVTDNGVGLTAARQKQATKDSLHRSVGLTLTEKRLQLLNPGEQQPAVTIRERTGPDKTVLGTEVQVRIALATI